MTARFTSLYTKAAKKLDNDWILDDFISWPIAALFVKFSWGLGIASIIPGIVEAGYVAGEITYIQALLFILLVRTPFIDPYQKIRNAIASGYLMAKGVEDSL